MVQSTKNSLKRGRGRPRKNPVEQKAPKRREPEPGFSVEERLRIGGALKVQELCALKGISRSKFFLDQRAHLVETDGGVVLNRVARQYLGLPELVI